MNASRQHIPTVAITGGLGFVGSNIARAFLETRPDSRVIMIDVGDWTPLLDFWFAGYEDRLTVLCADVQDPSCFEAVPELESVTHVVHAAAITLVAGWEREAPRRYVDVNTTGTLNVVEWARRLPRLERFVSMSTGGVYGEPTEGTTEEPQKEEGPRNPTELYSIAKAAAEDIVLRYGELFEFSAIIVRPSTVFGPMEGPTAHRKNMSLPYMIARSVVSGQPLLLSERSAGAGGDYISAEDTAALVVNLTIGSTSHSIYNVASGQFFEVPHLLALARELCPEFSYAFDDRLGTVDVDIDPKNRLACWNAYSIVRVLDDVGWAPRSIREQLRGYLEWARGSSGLWP